MHVNLILTPALLLALLKVDGASGELACVLLAQALFKLLLSPVAIHVNSEEGMVIFLALTVQLDPLSISRLVPDDLALQPASKLAIAVASTSFAASNTRVDHSISHRSVAVALDVEVNITITILRANRGRPGCRQSSILNNATAWSIHR